jgi:hypothetical protein
MQRMHSQGCTMHVHQSLLLRRKQCTVQRLHMHYWQDAWSIPTVVEVEVEVELVGVDVRTSRRRERLPQQWYSTLEQAP